MQTTYGVRSSYRFRIDPANGKQSPLAVWSPTAIKERIMDADISVEDGVADLLPCEARPAS
jgi:hypothetical protein